MAGDQLIVGTWSDIEAAIRQSHADALFAATSTQEWDVADVMAALVPFLRNDTP